MHFFDIRIVLPAAKYPKPDQQRIFFQSLFEKLDSSSGFKTGAISQLPIGGSSGALPIGDSAQPVAVPDERPVAFVNSVTSDYFSLLQIPLTAGRSFDETVGPSSPKVATIDEVVAARLWPGREAVGRSLAIFVSGNAVPHDVVGVVGNVKFQALDGQNRIPAIYVPFAQWPKDEMTILAAPVGRPSSEAADSIRQGFAK